MGQSSFKPRHAKNTGRRHNPRAKIDAMYDVTWEKYRSRYLKINRDCYACGKSAVAIDHLIPHQGDPVLFEKLDNHIPLCISCHNTVTSKFDRNHPQRGVLNIEKVKWLNARRFVTESWHPKKVRVLSYYK